MSSVTKLMNYELQLQNKKEKYTDFLKSMSASVSSEMTQHLAMILLRICCEMVSKSSIDFMNQFPYLFPQHVCDHKYGSKISRQFLNVLFCIRFLRTSDSSGARMGVGS